MFDQMIESERENASVRQRRGYFVFSSLVVGVLFLAAVVISIYAEDFALSGQNLEIQALLAPNESLPAERQKMKPSSPSPSASDTGDQTIRMVNQARTDETRFVPNTISTTPNTYVSRSYGEIKLGNTNTNALGSGRGNSTTGPSATDISSPVVADGDNSEKDTPPPVKVVPPQPKRTISIGVLNGKAVYLPKPPYPAAAIAVNAQGNVSVQIMLDESGKVVSAKAVDGNPLLRGPAERAAWQARFTPTLLSKVPVKVTGMIVYNFTRN